MAKIVRVVLSEVSGTVHGRTRGATETVCGFTTQNGAKRADPCEDVTCGRCVRALRTLGLNASGEPGVSFKNAW